MLNYIKRLVREIPNDAELGAKVREYTNNHRTCCDKLENRDVYVDANNNPYPICKKCGKIL